LEFVGENPEQPDDKWVAAPVKPGALVLIHGQVMIKTLLANVAEPQEAASF
jgi:hypothetical protein